MGPPRASYQRRGTLGQGTFFPEVLQLCASGPQTRGPWGARISNLGALRPIVSERGMSCFPFKCVPFWWTRAPIYSVGPSYCFRGYVNMCNIVDENTSTVLSTLSGIHSCQFHAIILYNLPKNDCFWCWILELDFGELHHLWCMTTCNLFDGAYIDGPWTVQ